MTSITTVQDHRRGCGTRQPHGIYLMADGLWGGCGKLPLPLERCIVCGGGIRVTRGLSFINPARLFEHTECRDYDEDQARCAGCVMSVRNLPTRGWLIGVGKKFYTPMGFIREALELGVSKRLAQIPRDLRIGEDYVFAAHPEAITRYVSQSMVLGVVPKDLDEDEDQPVLIEAALPPATPQDIQPIHAPGVIGGVQA